MDMPLNQEQIKGIKLISAEGIISEAPADVVFFFDGNEADLNTIPKGKITFSLGEYGHRQSILMAEARKLYRDGKAPEAKKMEKKIKEVTFLPFGIHEGALGILPDITIESGTSYKDKKEQKLMVLSKLLKSPEYNKLIHSQWAMAYLVDPENFMEYLKYFTGKSHQGDEPHTFYLKKPAARKITIWSFFDSQALRNIRSGLKDRGIALVDTNT